MNSGLKPLPNRMTVWKVLVFSFLPSNHEIESILVNHGAHTSIIYPLDIYSKAVASIIGLLKQVVTAHRFNRFHTVVGFHFAFVDFVGMPEEFRKPAIA